MSGVAECASMSLVGHAPPFAVYYEGDAYATANKIMGRQVAGRELIRALARRWPSARMHGLGTRRTSRNAMLTQLRGEGFTGTVRFDLLHEWGGDPTGALYYPAPPLKMLAHLRSLGGSARYSLMGVAHTLSSAGAMDQLCDLALAPFEPWDALICTSEAVRTLLDDIQTEYREWCREQLGAQRFVQVQRPVIPLGVDTRAFAPQPERRRLAREALGLQPEDTVLLFAGRLSFHAKANPAPMYQALQAVAPGRSLVCIEAGVVHNPQILEAFRAAQLALAPSVRFIWIDGTNVERYAESWRAADIFVSLTDNIQETFGLTPLEAMAAGLPVIAADWNGYKDTVRDGLDGVLVPTVMAPAGCGNELALRHACGVDSYDFYIGRTSLSTVVDPVAVQAALQRLLMEPQLRSAMGATGRERAEREFDWQVVLGRYEALAAELAALRGHAGQGATRTWPARADPFRRFAHYASRPFDARWQVQVQDGAAARLDELLGLAVANYGLSEPLLPRSAVQHVLAVALRAGTAQAADVVVASGLETALAQRALLWLWKFHLVRLATTGR